MSKIVTKYSSIFLSTPSARRATERVANKPGSKTISIHALREEGDLADQQSKPRKRNFYPRPPRGGRLGAPVWILAKPDFYPRPPRGGRHLHRYAAPRMMSFLSTPSARRATISAPPHSTSSGISIHALREEGDHWQTSSDLLRQEISIHALREEGDIFHRFYKIIWKNFYPRPPRGGRQPNSF